ncbi:TPA: hypothetical protein QHO11_003146 [Klebsiella oxytoca]|nr:hypothetical protein [Klebsiella oxytoca]
MKPVITLTIGVDAVPVADYRIVLELSACGRGFITAAIDRDCTGDLVLLDLGVNTTVYRWFTGYVERCGPAENGFKRLFIREAIGVMGLKIPVSLQHPTMRDVCAAVSDQAGVVFALPDEPYVDEKIPHFKSLGAGYLLLDSLGGVFGINDYCWYQLPDGTVYAGSYEHSRFASLPLDLPASFASSGAGGNTLRMPLIPSIRPGVVLNGCRITQIEVDGPEMVIRWASGRGVVGDPPEKRQIDRFYPELAAGLHLPKLGRVTGPTDSAALGDQSDKFRPRYAVNVQLLDENGGDDDSPELVAVPLPVTMAGPEGGFYQFPPEGTIVELGFINGRPDAPIVRNTLQDDQPLPGISPGEQLQQQRAGVSQRVTKSGSWQRETDQAIEESSRQRIVTGDVETRELSTRQTLIKGGDQLTVIGTQRLLAGGVVQLVDGDWSVAASGKMATRCASREDVTTGAVEADIGGTLSERITGIRKSVAAAHHILAPSIVIGSEAVNLMRLFTDTLDVLEELARQTAAHTHSNTGTPTNSGEISATAAKPVALRTKYGKMIG